jgi:protein-tyrosine-phosphatase
MKTLISAAAAAAMLSGCASSIGTRQIERDAKAGTVVDGVPFRIRDRLTLELYRKTDKGYELVNRQMETMADPSRLYVLNFTGQMLADTSVKFEQHPDGSLSSVKLGDASHLPEAVTAASAGVDSLVATDKAIRAARKAEAEQAETDAETAAEEAIAEADAIVASSQNAVELIYAARVLEQQLAELPAEAKPSERVALQGKLEVAKMKARGAAQKAGMDDPFPQ